MKHTCKVQRALTVIPAFMVLLCRPILKTLNNCSVHIVLDELIPKRAFLTTVSRFIYNFPNNIVFLVRDKIISSATDFKGIRLNVCLMRQLSTFFSKIYALIQQNYGNSCDCCDSIGFQVNREKRDQRRTKVAFRYIIKNGTDMTAWRGMV